MCVCWVFLQGGQFVVRLLSAALIFWTFSISPLKNSLKVFCRQQFKSVFLRKKLLAISISSDEAFLHKKLLDRCTHPHCGRRAKAGWIHLNFSTSTQANCWDERAARNWEWKCETRKAGRWISSQDLIFQSGFLFKIRWISFQGEFQSECLFRIRWISSQDQIFQSGFLFRIRWISFQGQVSQSGFLFKVKSFKVDFFSESSLSKWISFQDQVFQSGFLLGRP